MKKLFAIMIALAMLLCVAAVAEATDVVGVWYMNEVIMGGTSMDPVSFGMSMTITLNADGTAEAAYELPGQASYSGSGSWEMNGETVTITIDGAPADFTYADGVLSAEMEGMGTVVFSQDAPSGEAYAPAAAKADAAEADFAGDWNCVKIGAEGYFLDSSVYFEMLGVDPLTVSIEGSTVTLNGFLFNGTALTTAFADGGLVFETSTSEMFASIKAQMLEDGRMSISMGDGTDEAVFIMERVD